MRKRGRKRHSSHSRIVLLFVFCAALAAGWYGYQFWIQELSPEGNEADNEAVAATYFVGDSTPPAVAERLTDLLLDNSWQPAPESEADLVVSGTLGTATQQDADTALALYQVWVVAQPYSSYLASLSEVTSISTHVDHAAPLERVGEYTVAASAVGTDAPAADTSGLRLMTLQEIDPTYYTVSVSGVDPLSKQTWTDGSYPLISTVTISGPSNLIDTVRELIVDDGFISEHGYLSKLPTADDIVTVFKSGTTVAGGPGWQLCERRTGTIGYPIDNVKSRMAAADYAIISNESSFVDGCTQGAGTTAFCGKPTYLQNLLDMGIDIVSLTGNHMGDYGRDAFTDTMDLYTANGIKYFASGKNIDEAWQPLYLESPAGTIAFIGFNNMCPSCVLPDENSTGTAIYDETRLTAAMSQASSEADIIWVDTQLWPEYGGPGIDQIDLSRKPVDLGADIVTGVSSHEIQGMTFYSGKPVFYGLGNFLFDQMLSMDSRKGMALEVVVYGGAIRRMTLLPTLMYDYCQPRFYTGSEKDSVIQDFLSISDL